MILKIKDQDFIALADWATIEMFCIKKGIDLSGWPDFVQSCTKIEKGKMTERYSDMVLFVMCCLERGAEENNTEFTLKRNTVYSWFLSGHQQVMVDLLRDANGNIEQSKNPEAPAKGQE